MSCTRGDGRLEGLLNEGPEGFRGRKVMRKSNWEYVHTYSMGIYEKILDSTSGG